MEHPIPHKLWEHHDPTSTQMWKFKSSLERKLGKKFPDYNALYEYSITKRSDFWLHAFSEFPLVYTGRPPNPCVDELARMDSVPKWFEGVKLNFAQNILFRGDENGKPETSPGKEDEKVAVTEVKEGSFLEPIRHMRWDELRQMLGKLTQAMRARGLKKGDRVAVVASTSVDTLTVFLATTALGGLFSSSSTDMGTKGILDRLTQIRPKWIFFDDVAVYNGKQTDLRQKMKEVVEGMKNCKEFEALISQARFAERPADVRSVSQCMTRAKFIRPATSSELYFEQLEFSDPFLIVYSSGTTGQPKCIVHCVGGVVLNGHKEGRLHRCIDENSAQLQYTTTGWIMYLASVQVLLMGARMIMYDGSPFVPGIKNFVKLYGEQRPTHLGISPRYLQTLQMKGIKPREVADLSNMKVVTSTGMVLSNQLFEWFYDEGFPKSVQLDNISGGTDLAGSFGIGNPILPVYAGGCQCVSLGTPLRVFDQMVDGREGGKGVKGMAVNNGVPGELVSTAAFPTIPVMFWGENGKQRYFESYFARFDDVWTHGDFIMIHPITKNVLFLGRADGVLNPSGIRFGSAEIYNIVDARFSDRIADSICVGQRRPTDNDETVMLFLLMKPGVKFTKRLVEELKTTIRMKTSPRHVPKYIFETPEIPTTVNLKKVELPVKQIVSGKIIKPSGTLLNPRSLDYYYRFAKVEELVDNPRTKL